LFIRLYPPNRPYVSLIIELLREDLAVKVLCWDEPSGSDPSSELLTSILGRQVLDFSLYLQLFFSLAGTVSADQRGSP